MNAPTAWLSVGLGLLLRLGVPALLLVAMVWLMRRLDARWQSEAGQPRAAIRPPARQCWEVHQCSPERRATCVVPQHPQVPCWQQFRDRDGNLLAGCLACELFASLPAAQPAREEQPVSDAPASGPGRH